MNREIKFRAWDWTKKDLRPNSKGWYKQNGYILQKAPYHPSANIRGYVMEHRLIMENSLNRFLNKDEVVHHINQVRDDNRIENLEVYDNQPKHIEGHSFSKRNDNGKRIANDPMFEEIKFRLFDKDTGVVRIYTLSKLIGTTFRRGKFEFRGRWTGLKDKNGKEIYEGDQFGKMGGDVERPNEYEIHAKVYFDEDLSAFCIDDNRGGWEYLFDYLLKPRNEKEIIGNIYENPELLK